MCKGSLAYGYLDVSLYAAFRYVSATMMIICNYLHARINTYTMLTACQHAHPDMQIDNHSYLMRCLDEPTACIWHLDACAFSWGK